MSIYQTLGIETLINAAGTKTRLGGMRLAPEVVAAMAEAADACVDMFHLQSAASRIIAGLTGAEAGYVTCGAAAGLTLGAAACIAGCDPARIDRLPFTEDLPNEIIIFRSHRNSYDHGWRAAGARLVEVGLDDRVAGSGVRSLDPWEIEAAVTERSVAVAYVANRSDHPPLGPIVEIAHRHALPVLVDAAGQLPPVDNLRRFIAEGADLVAFSGGKAIGGPQSTGILCGSRALIQAVLLNHLDMDVDMAYWDPPQGLLERHEIRGLPRHGIGRGFKVSKEDVVGLLVALQRFAAGTDPAETAKKREIVDRVATALGSRIDIAPVAGQQWGAPRAELRFASRTAAEFVYRGLLAGSPRIALDPTDIGSGVLLLNTIDLRLDDVEPIVARIENLLEQLPSAGG